MRASVRHNGKNCHSASLRNHQEENHLTAVLGVAAAAQATADDAIEREERIKRYCLRADLMLPLFDDSDTIDDSDIFDDTPEDEYAIVD